MPFSELNWSWISKNTTNTVISVTACEWFNGGCNWKFIPPSVIVNTTWKLLQSTLRNLLGKVNNVTYYNNWCYDDYINLNNCNVVDTLIIRVYYNVRHFRTSKYTCICTRYFRACLINKAYTRAQQILGARAPKRLEILQ
jgi:hypothetical protein